MNLGLNTGFDDYVQRLTATTTNTIQPTLRLTLSQRPGSHGSGYQEGASVVEVCGDVAQMDCVRDDDRPLGGQTSDDGGRVEARDRSGGVESGQRRHTKRSTMIQRALQRLHRRKKKIQNDEITTRE